MDRSMRYMHIYTHMKCKSMCTFRAFPSGSLQILGFRDTQGSQGHNNKNKLKTHGSQGQKNKNKQRTQGSQGHKNTDANNDEILGLKINNNNDNDDNDNDDNDNNNDNNNGNK